MSGGNKKIKGSDGNTFSKDNQPKKRRGVSLVSKIKKMLADDPKTVTKILNAMIKKAEKGDLKAIEMLMDRVDGKPKQSFEFETKDIQPLEIIMRK